MPAQRKINLRDDAIIDRVEPGMVGMLRERVERSIVLLVGNVEDGGSFDGMGGGKTMDAAFLRALEEVVRGCERAGFDVS